MYVRREEFWEIIERIRKIERKLKNMAERIRLLEYKVCGGER